MEIIFNNLMVELGYDWNNISMDYFIGFLVVLGNYFVDQLIIFGLGEFCNEVNDYENFFYEFVNLMLVFQLLGNFDMVDFNCW